MNKYDWKELYLDEEKHDWETSCDDRGGLLIKYRDKPEQKVIMTESGKTFVAKFNGIDYFCIKPNANGSPAPFAILDGHVVNYSQWVSIDGLKITDEIALLRPMVYAGTSPKQRKRIGKLYGVDTNRCFNCIVMYSNVIDCWIGCHIATIDDLEDT